jgi:hypothetical protein
MKSKITNNIEVKLKNYFSSGALTPESKKSE